MSLSRRNSASLISSKNSAPQLDGGTRATNGKMTIADAVAIHRKCLEVNPRLKPNAKLYREKCIQGLLRSWASLAQTDIRKITTDE